MPRRDAATEGRPSGLEVRTIPAATGLEARAAADEAPGLVGYGSVYDSSSTIGSYYQFDEEVAKGAWAKTITEGDIRSMFNHDTNWLLGRTSAGTLRLSEDATGLRYEVDINADDSHAMSVHAKVARGDVSGSSVWFRVVREEWTEPTDDNGLERPKRRILEAQLFEVGPVVFPAFEATTVDSRSIDVVDSALRAAGVSEEGRRARIAADILADPAAAETELRNLFTRDTELRDAVCSCPTTTAPVTGDEGRAAEQAPGQGTPPTRHLPPAYYVARARGTAAIAGLNLKEKTDA